MAGRRPESIGKTYGCAFTLFLISVLTFRTSFAALLTYEGK